MNPSFRGGNELVSVFSFAEYFAFGATGSQIRLSAPPRKAGS